MKKLIEKYGKVKVGLMLILLVVLLGFMINNGMSTIALNQ